ncbi:hypothetical protein C1645_876066 [Glomus cerebriforme]|uniref:Uncharacterized protein n=1 Tax=Glomus cerebriforme TaxID=658196 RepID=A0A397T5T6_9GLOM|nr:hypothetical protein C1645_876066 [Glomus cerebriforme]
MDNQRHMINSLLNKSPKLITLDHICYFDHNYNELSFTKDPIIIEKEAHNWHSIYQQSSRIKDEWYSNILSPVTTEKFTSILCSCLSNKASEKSII